MNATRAGQLRAQEWAGPSLATARAWSLEGLQRHAPAVAGWVIPFALVVVLAFENGGYDVGLRSEVGIAIWWLIFVGAASGMLRFTRLGTPGWALIGIGVGLALWTGLGIAWSESAERSVIEFGRVVTYVGFLVLALALQRRNGLRRTISAVATAIVVVGLAALLSRLHPSWFPDAGLDTTALGAAEIRLNYPLNYWNGLAAVMALGIPLALTLALRSRSIVVQALMAAAVPMMALTAFYTLSRGGMVEIGVGLVVLVALYPGRLSAAPTLLVTSVASAALIGAATQRDVLEDGIVNQVSRQQGDEMLALLLIACAGVALVQVAIGLLRRYGLGPRLAISREVAWAAGIVAAVVAAVVIAGPGDIGSRWEEFKQPGSPGGGLGAQRFESGKGSGRWQLWGTAADANETAPLTGIGPGTFEFWQAREGEPVGFVRDAHSLYLEMLAELGVVGLVLIIGLVGGVLVIGVRRIFRASDDKRSLLAGAVAACAVFATAGAIDWVWELAVLPCVFLLLAGAISGPYVVRARLSRVSRRPRASARRRLATQANAIRAAIACAAVAALIAIAVPYAGSSGISASAAEARAGNLPAALDETASARAIQPYAASPNLQRALLLQGDGRIAAAADAARRAVDAESTNWRTWLVLSAIEARRGNAERAVDAYREARSLNPRSVIFTQLR